MNDRKDVQCYRCEIDDVCGKPGASFKFDDHGQWVYADHAYKVINELRDECEARLRIINEMRLTTAALQSEIDAYRAGEMGYKRRIAEVEGKEKTAMEIMCRAMNAKHEDHMRVRRNRIRHAIEAICPQADLAPIAVDAIVAGIEEALKP